jgi:hypothetical protein
MTRSTLVLVLALGGCGEPLTVADMAPDLRPDPNDPSHCDPMNVASVPNEGATHVPCGTKVTYKHNPPASGSHWSAAQPNCIAPHPWGVYLDEGIPEESWVHNLEHGGVVFLYSCNGANGWDYDLGVSPDGGGGMPCPEVTSVLAQISMEKPTGTLVTGYNKPTRRVTAVAWDWIYQSDTVDATALRCFLSERWGRGPEKLF